MKSRDLGIVEQVWDHEQVFAQVLLSFGPKIGTEQGKVPQKVRKKMLYDPIC